MNGGEAMHTVAKRFPQSSAGTTDETRGVEGLFGCYILQRPVA